MTAVLTTDEVVLHHGDCIDVMRAMPDASVDAIVTDPPYGLSDLAPRAFADVLAAWLAGDRAAAPKGSGFMGKSWDAFVPPPAVWDEAYRVLKPGGHLLAFAGSRTDDLMGLAIRLAGFEIRDGIAWLYGSGFPKSMDVAAAIDKVTTVTVHDVCGREAIPSDVGGDLPWSCLTCEENVRDAETHTMRGSELREVVGSGTAGAGFNATKGFGSGTTTLGGEATSAWDVTAAGSRAAQPWQGWGTALKPAFEPIVVARKPLAGTVAANVLAHGTGALNIDATRIPTTEHLGGGAYSERGSVSQSLSPTGMNRLGAKATREYEQPKGRFPANVVVDTQAAAELDEQSGTLHSGMMRAGTRRESRGGVVYGADTRNVVSGDTYGDSGGASRFFYTAKADSAERPVVDGIAHPTVKPLDLVRWLVRLVTPRGGVVLEPFAGSGTTLEAAVLEGFRAIGIEREADYIPLIQKRLDKPHAVGLDIFGEIA